MRRLRKAGVWHRVFNDKPCVWTCFLKREEQCSKDWNQYVLCWARKYQVKRGYIPRVLENESI